jgi:hypothetical protein
MQLSPSSFDGKVARIGHCHRHSDCTFKLRFSFIKSEDAGPYNMVCAAGRIFLLVQRTRSSCDGQVLPTVEADINKQRFSADSPAIALTKMAAAGIPPECRPTERALEGHRHRKSLGGQRRSYPASFVETFRHFLANPPHPVTIISGVNCESVVSEKETRVYFYKKDNMEQAINFPQLCTSANLIVDGTFNTNVQKLVLCCIGVCVLRVVEGIVKNSFLPLVFCLTHKENAVAWLCYSLLFV